MLIEDHKVVKVSNFPLSNSLQKKEVLKNLKQKLKESPFNFKEEEMIENFLEYYEGIEFIRRNIGDFEKIQEISERMNFI